MYVLKLKIKNKTMFINNICLGKEEIKYSKCNYFGKQ